MKLIAHRGNTCGINLNRENTISYIKEALDKNFDCEIDIWLCNNSLYFGHDKPRNLITSEDLIFIYENANKFWVHCKTPETLNYFLSKSFNLNIFFHNNDDCVLTSQRYIWTYPNKILTENSIMVKFDKVVKEDLMKNIYGICSDDFSLINNSL